MKRFGRILFLTFLGGIVAGGAWAVVNRRTIYDWARLYGYMPPPAIEALAAATTMNDDTRRLFYVQHPELNDRDDFNAHCGHITEATIVLGCYISSQGIYLFDVDEDPRLQGVEEVTSAHEVLHAAYERLDEAERARIDNLTKQAFEALTDRRIMENVASYHERDPSVVPNELHSILGTEVRDLPEELEQYYKRYFNDRSQIVALSEQYESEITKRRDRAESLADRIDNLKTQIDQLETDLKNERSALESLRPSVNTQAEVQSFNARVDAYNASIGDLNDLINQHNNLVKEYKANSIEQEELFKALSSQPTL